MGKRFVFSIAESVHCFSELALNQRSVVQRTFFCIVQIRWSWASLFGEAVEPPRFFVRYWTKVLRTLDISELLDLKISQYGR